MSYIAPRSQHFNTSSKSYRKPSSPIKVDFTMGFFIRLFCVTVMLYSTYGNAVPSIENELTSSTAQQYIITLERLPPSPNNIGYDFKLQSQCEDLDWWHPKFECFSKISQTHHCREKDYKDRCPLMCHHCLHGMHARITRHTAEPAEDKEDGYGPPVSKEEKSLCQTAESLVQLGSFKLIMGLRKLSWKGAHFCCKHVGAALFPFNTNMDGGGGRYYTHIQGGNSFWVSAREADKNYQDWWWGSSQILIDPQNQEQYFLKNPNQCAILFRHENAFVLDARSCLDKHRFVCLRTDKSNFNFRDLIANFSRINH